MTDLMNEIKNLEAVTVGGYDSRSAANQAWNGTKTGYYLRKMLDVTLMVKRIIMKILGSK